MKKYVCEVCGTELKKSHIRLSINTGKGFSGIIENPPDPFIQDPIPTESFQFCVPTGKKNDCIAVWFRDKMWNYPQAD